ncbi:MAG: hypothetical protein JWO51_464 [Rhodospirillales bacterium]|jgi:hypothetical protein|nr:hypothetical protein [Rhodospirillales bacterium]
MTRCRILLGALMALWATAAHAEDLVTLPTRPA